jgi:crotonobetainyl-CoA:carnitine CoA-transferase CaiB-like acyl-CoA transferase
VRHREILVPLLAERLRRRPRAEWLAALEAAKVPCGPINDLDDVFADPQVQARQMTTLVAHPLNDHLTLVSSPMKFSATPVTLRRPPPLLGQHTDEVLREIGVDDARLRALREQRVI